MKINLNKLYRSIGYQIRMPRNVKKQFLGFRISKCELRRMVKETKIGPAIKTMWERIEMNPHGAFCPNCGCKHYRGTGNMTDYPEHWEYFYCIRCNYKIGTIDNSPFVHILEELKYKEA